MFDTIQRFWNERGFDILVVGIIAVLAVLALFRLGKKGTWYKYKIEDKTLPQPTQSTRRPPRESKGEVECRRVLESIYKKPFNKTRPDFLNNPVTGGSYNLELDCYNPELRIAVEYNGVQHYKYSPFFHKNKEAFMNQKYRDEIKRRICQDVGITLIEVPYTVKIGDIQAYLLKHLTQKGML